MARVKVMAKMKKNLIFGLYNYSIFGLKKMKGEKGSRKVFFILFF